MEMRMYPTRKYSPAKTGSRGGPRPGAGRPPGSRDLVPRRRGKDGGAGATPEEQLQEARRIIGELQKENEILRNELNLGGPFDGDSKDLLTAVLRGEYHASPTQIYAAKALLDREHPPAVPVDAATITLDSSIYMSQEYLDFERRALKVLRRHPEALQDWLKEFSERPLAVEVDDGQ